MSVAATRGALPSARPLAHRIASRRLRANNSSRSSGLSKTRPPRRYDATLRSATRRRTWRTVVPKYSAAPGTSSGVRRVRGLWPSLHAPLSFVATGGAASRWRVRRALPQTVGVGFDEESVQLAGGDAAVTATGEHDVSEIARIAELLHRRCREVDPPRELTRSQKRRAVRVVDGLLCFTHVPMIDGCGGPA